MIIAWKIYERTGGRGTGLKLCTKILTGAQPAYSPWLSSRTFVTECQSKAKVQCMRVHGPKLTLYAFLDPRRAINSVQ